MVNFTRSAVLCLAAVMVLATSSTAVGPLKVSGSLITEYRDREGGTYGIPAVMQANTAHGQFRLVQTSLKFRSELTDYSRAQFTMVSSGGAAPVISEGYLEWAGLPYDGLLTLGRFYKPNGAPLETINLSYPALMFHTGSVVGLKSSFEFYPWRTEIGLVNNSALSQTGTFLSNTRAFGRPTRTGAGGNATTNNKEIYAMVGWRDGGEWGSLDVNFTWTEGHISRADRDLLRGLNILAPGINEHTRRRYLGSVVDYQYGPWRAYGEYITADEGPLDLKVWNLGASYRVGKFNYALGYDRLDNNTIARPMNLPESWRRKRYTAGATYDYQSNMQFALVYERNYEFFDRTPSEKDGLDNDAIIFQIVTSF